MFIMGLVAVFGTRQKMKSAAQIRENYRQGKYANMSKATNAKIRVIAGIQLFVVLAILLLVALVFILLNSTLPHWLSSNLILTVSAVFFFIALIVLMICAFLMERIMKDPK